MLLIRPWEARRSLEIRVCRSYDYELVFAFMHGRIVFPGVYGI
jgi:hypothetical protein